MRISLRYLGFLVRGPISTVSAGRPSYRLQGNKKECDRKDKRRGKKKKKAKAKKKKGMGEKKKKSLQGCMYVCMYVRVQ